MKTKLLSAGALLTSVFMNAQIGFLNKINPFITPQNISQSISQQFRGNGNQQVQAAYYLPGKEIYYEWDTISNVWNLIDSAAYTYYTGWPNEGKPKDAVIYNAPGFNPFNKTFYRYHSTTGKWQAQVDFSYDNVNNQWIHSYRDTMIYNSNNQLIEYRSEFYDVSTQTWTTSIKRLYTYNSNNKVIEIEEYHIDPMTNALAPFQKKSITYNSQQSVHTITTLDYDQATTSYTNNSQEVYLYDSNGKVNLIYSLSYSSSTNSFDTTLKADNIVWHSWISSDLIINDPFLNENEENLYSDIIVKFRVSPGVYVNMLKIVQNYDPIDDKPTLYTWYNWDVGTNNWKIGFSTQVNYTRSASLNNMVTEAIYQQWAPHLNAYRNYERYRYGDPQMMTAVENYNNTITGLLIYPNPSHDQFTIQLNSHPMDADINLKILNLNGQLIQSNNIKNNTTVNIDNLSKGMYILEITDSNNNTAFTKLIVE